MTIDDLYSLRKKAKNMTFLKEFKWNGRSGEALGIKKGCSGHDVISHQPYSPGHSVKAIDWRLTARKQEPWMKNFRESNEMRFLCILDLTAGMFFTSQSYCKSSIVLQIFALLGWKAIDENCRLDVLVITNNDFTKFYSGKGEKYFCSLLQKIMMMCLIVRSEKTQRVKKKSYLNDAMTKHLTAKNKNVKLCVISDFMVCHPKEITVLNKFLNQQENIIIQVYDPVEIGLLDQEFNIISNGLSTIDMDLSRNNLLDDFNNYCRHYKKEVDDFFNNQKSLFVHFSTERKVINQI